MKRLSRIIMLGLRVEREVADEHFGGGCGWKRKG
jgi:hypothetical protein